jgi:hypothetical protein
MLFDQCCTVRAIEMETCSNLPSLVSHFGKSDWSIQFHIPKGQSLGLTALLLLVPLQTYDILLATVVLILNRP